MVSTRLKANSVAYTSYTLPLHSDLPYYEAKPGVGSNYFVNYYDWYDPNLVNHVTVEGDRGRELGRIGGGRGLGGGRNDGRKRDSQAVGT